MTTAVRRVRQTPPAPRAVASSPSGGGPGPTSQPPASPGHKPGRGAKRVRPHDVGAEDDNRCAPGAADTPGAASGSEQPERRGSRADVPDSGESRAQAGPG